MSPDNIAANAAEELARSDECLREAQLLLEAGMGLGATSRAYYGVFHAARALLFSLEIQPRSHRAMVALLSQHFIQPGRLPSEFGRLVSHLQRDREDVDYAIAPAFSDRDAESAFAAAKRFHAAARDLLASAAD